MKDKIIVSKLQHMQEVNSVILLAIDKTKKILFYNFFYALDLKQQIEFIRNFEDLDYLFP